MSGGKVQIRYGREELRHLMYDADYRQDLWPQAVVCSYWRRHQYLAAAKDRADLQALRSLDLRPETGEGAELASIRLENPARLLLDFDKVDSSRLTVVDIMEARMGLMAP